MPEPMTPVPKLVDQRSRAVRSRAAFPHLVDNANARGRPVIVIGSPADIPRALEHPAVVNGRFGVKAALAIEPGDSTGEIDGLAGLLRSTEAGTVLIAGPVG